MKTKKYPGSIAAVPSAEADVVGLAFDEDVAVVAVVLAGLDEGHPRVAGVEHVIDDGIGRDASAHGMIDSQS